MKKPLLILVATMSILVSACSMGKGNNNVEKADPSPSESSTQTSSSAPGTPNVGKLNFTRETYPKVDGSTATIPLSEAIASSMLGMSKDEAQKFIKHNTTHMAYVNLIDNKADIIFVTEPSKEELKMASDAKVELEIVPIVKEGFVFLVNSKNPVSSLTSKQIQDIYQGKITNWKAVGGEDKEIVAYQREANSGSQTIMEQMVMKGLHMMESPKTIVQGMAELIESIAKYDNSDKALGYSVFYYAKTMYNRDTIKLIAVDGIMPDNKTISDGKYPFSSSYYAVIRKSEAADSPSRKLLEWLLGNDGQKLAEDAGYVPLKVR